MHICKICGELIDNVCYWHNECFCYKCLCSYLKKSAMEGNCVAAETLGYYILDRVPNKENEFDSFNELDDADEFYDLDVLDDNDESGELDEFEDECGIVEYSESMYKRLLESVKFFRIVAKIANAKKCFWIGDLYLKKHYYHNALEFYEAAANQGHIEAQYRTGVLYNNKISMIDDIGIDINDKKIVSKIGIQTFDTMYTDANDAYADDAQRFYCYSLLTDENLEKAFKYFLMAANQGHIIAQYYVARFYYYGVFVKEDTNKAIDYINIAINQTKNFKVKNCAEQLLKTINNKGKNKNKPSPSKRKSTHNRHIDPRISRITRDDVEYLGDDGFGNSIYADIEGNHVSLNNIYTEEYED